VGERTVSHRVFLKSKLRMPIFIKTITSSRLADLKIALLRLTVLVVALSFVACHKPAAQPPAIPPSVEYAL
jgi:hypothetical protein